ncbi:SDR family NAD(P)-dependent oxidoreductase [Corallococcus sp. CA049B]|uniref:SDR family NAD(P)-dependent oxidoreductase n=1 Tax=Corallococcus sp. CA049B TaxID=2316730 RepID=UPI001F3A3027|nr:SDR family NAD(P)-dependent oxidoreductase [Corallococcus sp. CA049B]
MRNQAVLVTGASRGLGRALMEAFARRGARAVGVARDAKALEAAVAPLKARGLAVHGLAFDVGDKQAIYPLVGAASGSWRPAIRPPASASRPRDGRPHERRTLAPGSPRHREAPACGLPGARVRRHVPHPGLMTRVTGA